MGLILTGGGLSITIEAGFMKGSTGSLWHWIVLGTLGLIIFNSGLALVGKAAVLLAELRNSEKEAQ